MLTRASARSHLLALTAALGLCALAPCPAQACGGMLFESHAERLGGMNAQELFLSLTPEESVLVLSASFVDASGDKAFLLPLRAAPTEVRDADEGLFIALETGTVPIVTIDTLSSPSGGIACGALDGGAGGRGPDGGDIEVLERGMTASYDYVVVGGETGTGLSEWLDGEGFSVPADVAGALDTYIEGGWYFLAAKLAPERAEGRVAPLELRLPAMHPTATIPFGLASMSLGPSDELDILLYISSPQTILPRNYDVEVIAGLVEARGSSESNYAELYDEIVGGAPRWVLESSQEWEPSVLTRWAWGLLEYELNVDAEYDEAWLEDFSARLGYASGRLSRLRTRLGKDELVDLQLDAAQDMDVEREIYVSWDPDGVAERGGCSTDEGSLAGLALLGVLGFVRRRRVPASRRGS